MAARPHIQGPRAVTCTCGHVRIGMEQAGLRSWSDRCGEHGVGTPYFQALAVMPYGYANERDTTREEWLEFLEEERR